MLLLGLLQVTAGSPAASAADGQQNGPLKLGTSWTSGGAEKVLKAWTLDDLKLLRKTSSREADPESGKVKSFKGVLLSNLVEKALEQLPPDQRASVDLLVVRNGQGGSAVIPRSLITKYPVLLAIDGQTASVVVPWTSHSRVKSEGLPLESYFVREVASIELTNYRERYTSLFLKRRTDPLAMRGEKLFVQDCAGCHSSGKGPTLTDLSAEAKARQIASTSAHPEVTGVRGLPKLTDRDRRALVNYLDAYRGENPGVGVQAPQGPQTAAAHGSGGMVPAANAAVTPQQPGQAH